MLRWLHISGFHFNDNDMSTVFVSENYDVDRNGAR